MKYLYGAAVQGIQNFIFQTNQLKDIVGASELVDNICTSAFDQYARNGKSILRAAGNIKFLFEDEQSCRKAVLEFPRKVMNMAPGITISQAVVALDNDNDFPQAIETLESRLRIQRNLPSKNLAFGYSGVLRSRKTGLPVTKIEDDEYIDLATDKKREWTHSAKFSLCDKFFGHHIMDNSFAYDISNLTGDNEWIAIIHADGNGLGKIVQTVGSSIGKLSDFSQALDTSTITAAQKAYEATIKSDASKDITTKAAPFRPIVLGGDDLTVICRGSLALPFTRYFLDFFEKETETNLAAILKESPGCGIAKLTACAGIAFIKSSYPFYYGYNLAEKLCAESKKTCKKLEKSAPSCLQFHKVQDSFIEDYGEIIRRELTLDNGSTLAFGPYFLNEREGDGYWSIEHLEKYSKELESKEGNALKSGLRQWLSLAYNSMEEAKQKGRRIASMLPTKLKDVYFEAIPQNTDKYPVYDILSLHTINNQKTK